MGRKKKYNTDDELNEANRLKRERYYEKNKIKIRKKNLAYYHENKCK